VSEPKHIWAVPSNVTKDGKPYGRPNSVGMWWDTPSQGGVHPRYTLTDGDEYRALIELAREALKAYPHSAVGKEGALRDLLDYLEGDK